MIELVTGTWTSLPAWLQTTLVALGQILAVTITVILCVAYLTLAEQRGFDVTLLDISSAMLELARQKAISAGLDQLHIVEGNAADLSIFPDHSFDVVLNMDGAISFCGSQALQAIKESCRVCRRKLIITVSHRAQMGAVMVSSNIKVLGHVGASAEHMLEKGEWHQEQFAENATLSTGMTQNYMGALRAFLPGELRQFLNEHG